jgi:hypothetical protein
MLDRVYQECIDRTRKTLDVEKIRTIFGWKNRPHNHTTRSERIVDASQYDLTVFKIHYGKLSLKMYDKGDRILRIEAIAHNVKELRCGKLLEKLSDMVGKLKTMVFDFLNVICAAHVSYLDATLLEDLPKPTQRGTRRLTGVDIQKPGMRVVSEAVLALSSQPGGFTAKDLAERVCEMKNDFSYMGRHASYDLMKLRGKGLVEQVPRSRCYRCSSPGIRTLAGTITLLEKVIKPVLSGVCKKKPGRPPKDMDRTDTRYSALIQDMYVLLQELRLAA